MEIPALLPHIEALIFASDKPLTSSDIVELINNAFGFMDDKVSNEQIDGALQEIVEKYSSDYYPFEVRQSGGGWQFLTKKEYHKTVVQLHGDKFLKRLSAAALETLAIIAYKQPITKGEIETIRGVSSDYSVQKLLEKELIVITGRNEQMPGHPLVYATSKTFMDYFGLNSVEDLPKIKEVLADQLVAPTIIHHTDFESSNLVVSDDGELIESVVDKTGENPSAGVVNATPNETQNDIDNLSKNEQTPERTNDDGSSIQADDQDSEPTPGDDPFDEE